MILNKEISRFLHGTVRVLYSSNAHDTFFEPGYSVAVSSPGLGGLVVCAFLSSHSYQIGFAVACLMKELPRLDIFVLSGF